MRDLCDAPVPPGAPAVAAGDLADKALATYVAPKVAVSAVRLVRKRKVLVLNGQFRPKRSKNGLYQGHTTRTSVGNSTSEVVRNPGSLPRPYAHLFTKTLLIPFV